VETLRIEKFVVVMGFNALTMATSLKQIINVMVIMIVKMAVMKKSASTSKIVMTTLCLNVEMESVSLTNIIVINMIIVAMGLMKLDAVSIFFKQSDQINNVKNSPKMFKIAQIC